MTDATPTEKHIAQQHCHDAWCIGIDADGATHYWSQYFETIIVIEDGDADVFELADTPCDILADWRDHVATKRGWSDCRIGGSIIEDIQTAAEVLR